MCVVNVSVTLTTVLMSKMVISPESVAWFGGSKRDHGDHDLTAI